MKLHRVDGVSNRFDAWWDFGTHKAVSCPRCGYIQTLLAEIKLIDCPGCGKRTEVELV